MQKQEEINAVRKPMMGTICLEMCENTWTPGHIYSGCSQIGTCTLFGAATKGKERKNIYMQGLDS